MDLPTPPAPEPPLERTDVTRLHLSNWVKALPFAGLLSQLPRLVPAHAVGPDVPALVALASMALTVALLMVGLRRINDRRVESGRLRVDAEGLHWNGALLVPRPKLTVGVVMRGIQSSRTQVAARVRISRKGGPRLEFGVHDVDQGREVLHALGLDATQSTASFRTGSRLARSHPLVWLGMLAAPFGLMTVAGVMGAVWAAPAALLTMLAAMVPLAVPTNVVVGTDGVLIKWFGTRRFVPFADLASVAPEGLGVRLALRDGRSVPLRVERRRSDARIQQAEIERDALIARIEEARNTAMNRDTAVDPETVARGDHDTPAWVAALKALAHRDGGMRTAPVSRDQLFELVSNTTLDPSARAGAAAALGLQAAPPERERLRVAAASIASPKLRVVVEAAAGGDEKKLVAALDDLPDDRARSRRAG